MDESVITPEVSDVSSEDASFLLVFEGMLPNEQEDAIKEITTENDAIRTDMRLLPILQNILSVDEFFTIGADNHLII